MEQNSNTVSTQCCCFASLRNVLKRFMKPHLPITSEVITALRNMLRLPFVPIFTANYIKCFALPAAESATVKQF